MTASVLGYEADTAEQMLEHLGLCVSRVEYVSRRGIPQADSTRVIRQRNIGNNSIEITVSHFRVKMLDN